MAFLEQLFFVIDNSFFCNTSKFSFHFLNGKYGFPVVTNKHLPAKTLNQPYPNDKQKQKNAESTQR